MPEFHTAVHGTAAFLNTLVANCFIKYWF